VPVTFDLRENDRVVYFKISDPWTLEEVLAKFAETTAIRDQLYLTNPNRQVHSLIDLTEAKTAPPGALRSRNSPGMTHASRGKSVAAVTAPLVRDIMITIFKVMHTDGALVETVDEAWAYLRPILDQPETENPTDSDLKPPQNSRNTAIG